MKIRYKEIDVFRGIAALCVVLFHYTYKNNGVGSFLIGRSALDIFFFISGFVIFYSIDIVSSTKEFIINRFSRLFPIYWICVTLTFSIHLFAYMPFDQESIIRYLGNLTMLQFYLKIQNLDFSYWSLIVELIFYLLISVIHYFKSIKFIIPIGIIIVSFSLLNDIFLENHFLFLQKMDTKIPLYSQFPLFFSGIIFYKMVKDTDKTSIKYVSCLILCYIARLALFDDGRTGNDVYTIEEYALILFFHYCIFILFIYNKLKFIIQKPLLFLGKISYSLYLLHQFIGKSFLIPFLQKNIGLNYFISFNLSIIIIILISTLLSYKLEDYLNLKSRNFLTKKLNLKT